MQKAARTGFYDIMGHLDVIKRFNYKPEGRQQEVAELEQKTLAVIAEAGIAMDRITSYNVCYTKLLRAIR